MMTQTLGFACPSATGEYWNWKRALRIVEGTGKFDGVKGTVFISGRRTVGDGRGIVDIRREYYFSEGCVRNETGVSGRTSSAT